MSFALITVPHFYNFLFWNEIFMPVNKMGMSESHSEYVDDQAAEILNEIELAKNHDFNPYSIAKSLSPRSRTAPSSIAPRLKGQLHDYGSFQQQYRNFLLENANLAISNWKTHLIELDQRLQGAETIYGDFLNKLAHKEDYPELFENRNGQLEFLMQVKPQEAVLNLDSNERMGYVYQEKILRPIRR
ncbi:MAG: hypothetical protein R2827_16000 [Bdellovibrionales bacterium]